MSPGNLTNNKHCDKNNNMSTTTNTVKKRFGGGTGTAIGLVPSLSLFTNKT